MLYPVTVASPRAINDAPPGPFFMGGLSTFSHLSAGQFLFLFYVFFFRRYLVADFHRRILIPVLYIISLMDSKLCPCVRYLPTYLGFPRLGSVPLVFTIRLFVGVQDIFFVSLLSH